MSRATVRLVGVIACLGVGGLWAASAQADGNLGKVNPYVVPLAVALFFFILTARRIYSPG